MKTPSFRFVLALFMPLVLIGWIGCQTATTPTGAQTAKSAPGSSQILFLHHSTGECIWNGGVREWFEAYNTAHGTRYEIRAQAFPKESPYGWENYPYDYWNIWVRHAGSRMFRDEPTLESLTPRYDVIVFKHCFPVSNIEPDTGTADVASSDRRQENYKLQYAALKEKLRSFPRVKFVVWTGAALVQGETDEDSARRAQDFFEWVRREWDEPGDNIFLWDFRALETGGGLYLRPEYAAGDSHPNEEFSRQAAPLFAQRLVDVIEGRGDLSSQTGESGGGLVPPAAGASPEVAPAMLPTEAREPAPIPEPALGDSLVLDDAEAPARRGRLWGEAATYVDDSGSNVIRINFSSAPEEDWGEYGRQRVVFSRPFAKNLNVRPFRYLALHMKSDREMEVVLTLVTLPDPAGPRDQPHFHFSAYLHPTQVEWKTVTLDLSRLEIAAVGESAYEQAGRPARPQELTMLRLATSAKHAGAAFVLDDIVFYGELPESLRDTVLEP